MLTRLLKTLQTGAGSGLLIANLSRRVPTPTRENGDFELNETDSLHVSEEECEGGEVLEDD